MKKFSFKNLLALSLASLMALSFTGCSTKDATIKIGVNQFAPHPSLVNCYDGFVEGLKESGYENGKNVTIDLQNAQADMAKANSISSAFVAKNYDLLCGIATPSAQSAYNNAQAKDIPVIFTAVSDPVRADIVKSLENPGNNVTGTSDTLPVEAQLKKIRAFLPEANKIGILYTLSEPNSMTQIEIYNSLAPQYGFEIISKGINETKDIQLATDVILQDIDCMTNLLDNTVVESLPIIAEKANQKKIPIFGSEEEQLKSGCVAAEGIDYFELGVETGKMAARVLKGEKASEIPVLNFKASTPFVNKEACEFLGIDIPSDYANATPVETSK